MNEAQEINQRLQEAVVSFYEARLKANECSSLMIDWSEENSEEAGRRMQAFYQAQDRMFACSRPVYSKLANAVRMYRFASDRVNSHPDSYKSVGGNNAEITKLFQDMNDRESEMFALVGIDYHEKNKATGNTEENTQET